MLFLRFLAGTGGALLLLLLAANAYLPEPTPAAEQRPIDRSIIRITSTQKGPERVVYDTSLPTIVPPAQTVADTAPVAPTRIIAASTRETSTREAMAQLPPDSPELSRARVASKEARSLAPKPRRLARRAPVYYPAPPRQVADNFFGFFQPWH